VRIRTVSLVCLGLIASGLFVLAQTSTRAPATAAPRAPAFEYLGRLQAELGTRTVIENGPQGTRTIVQVLGGRFDGPRLKASVQTPAGDWITNRKDGTYRLDVRLTLKTDDGALDRSKIDYFQAYLRDVWTEVTRLKQQGVSAEEAAKRADLTRHKDHFPIQGPGVPLIAVARIYDVIDRAGGRD